MNKEQKAKFEKWFGSANLLDRRFSETARGAWEACLEANGIGEESSIPEGYFKIGEKVVIFKDDIWQEGYIVASDLEGGTLLHSSVDVRRIPACEPKADGANEAPEWVIDMMRAGKPVRCKVWDDISPGSETDVYVTGYDIKAEKPYCDEFETTWQHAEPISAWEPESNELVFYQCNNVANVGMVISKRFGDEDTYTIRTAEGDTIIRSIASIKRFHDSTFSKPWSEIS